MGLILRKIFNSIFIVWNTRTLEKNLLFIWPDPANSGTHKVGFVCCRPSADNGTYSAAVRLTFKSSIKCTPVIGLACCQHRKLYAFSPLGSPDSLHVFISATWSATWTSKILYRVSATCKRWIALPFRVLCSAHCIATRSFFLSTS